MEAPSPPRPPAAPNPGVGLTPIIRINSTVIANGGKKKKEKGRIRIEGRRPIGSVENRNEKAKGKASRAALKALRFYY